MTAPPTLAGRIAARVLAEGSLASALSAAVLARRGRTEIGSPWAALNAPSHWFWGKQSLRRNALSWRYTGVGALTHHASAIFWAIGYDWLQSLRREPTPTTAFVDAAAVTAIAALVDLKLIPERLTPGFERRLSRPGLAWTYVGFGLGLALGGWLLQRRR